MAKSHELKIHMLDITAWPERTVEKTGNSQRSQLAETMAPHVFRRKNYLRQSHIGISQVQKKDCVTDVPIPASPFARIDAAIVPGGEASALAHKWLREQGTASNGARDKRSRRRWEEKHLPTFHAHVR
ncbi:hypothetical protein N7490_004859 [Penicillium lividum]|nr:hypothetical protein N7490_004859 [Penicillium lividum]